MKHKDAYIRYKLIDQRIRRKPYPSLDQIVNYVAQKQDVSVSVSSIQKDIHSMRYCAMLAFYAPIEFDRKIHAYIYTDDEFTIDVNELVKEIKKLREKLQHIL